MEEATGAPSSFADWDPRRLRASGRDGGGIVNRPPSSLTMLLSRHTRRREFIALLGGAAAGWPLAAHAQQASDAGGRLSEQRLAADASRIKLARGVPSGFEGSWARTEGQNVRDRIPLGRGSDDRSPAPGGRIGPPAGGCDCRRRQPSSALAAKAATTTIPIVFTQVPTQSAAVLSPACAAGW